MKVNILGTEYNLIVNDVLEVPDADGLCKEYTKEISIRKMENMLCDQDTNEDKKKRYDEVLRHEIIHAFFTESGLDDYAGKRTAEGFRKILNCKIADFSGFFI